MADQSYFCKTTILNLLKTREPLFGGWRIVSFIGSGAYGCVFKLKRIDLGQDFVSALKVMMLTRKLDRAHSSLESIQQAVAQEASEITHLYSLGGHQNVVAWHNHQVFYVREKESVSALVAVMMDYMPNSLTRVMSKGPLPWEQAFGILSDCLKGLQHVHSKEILHRDIKPDNIFLADDGTAKIGDFGVARRMSEQSHAETRVGTPLYIAPEVLKDPLGEGYSYPVDVYSMGLVAYEMILGALPFEKECEGNRSCMVKKRLAGEPVLVNAAVPHGVKQCIQNALAYKPAERYATAGEFLRAVERVVDTGGRETFSPAQGVMAPKQNGVKSTGSSFRPESDDNFPPPPRQDASPVSSTAVPYKPYDWKDNQEPSLMGRIFVNDSVQRPDVIIIMAIVGAVVSLLMQSDELHSTIILLFFYLLLPIYFIIVSRGNAALTSVCFFLSLSAYNWITVKSIQGVMDTLSLMLLGLYVAVSVVMRVIRGGS